MKTETQIRENVEKFKTRQLEIKKKSLIKELWLVLDSQSELNNEDTDLWEQIVSHSEIQKGINFVKNVKVLHDMWIEGKKLNIKDHYLNSVTYVPAHAKGNTSHKDCEQGVIVDFSEQSVAVLYTHSRTVQTTNSSDLVWG